MRTVKFILFNVEYWVLTNACSHGSTTPVKAQNSATTPRPPSALHSQPRLPPPGSGNHGSISVPIALSFLKCHINGITQCIDRLEF